MNNFGKQQTKALLAKLIGTEIEVLAQDAILAINTGSPLVEWKLKIVAHSACRKPLLLNDREHELLNSWL